MKKLLGIVVLGLLLSGNAYSAILNYQCDSKKTASQTLWLTDQKRTVDTKKKILIIESSYTYKPMGIGKARYYNFKYEVPMEIDDQKIKYFGTNKSEWQWEYEVYENKKFNYNDPKRLKKLIKKYGSPDKRISHSVWYYKKDRSPIIYEIYKDGYSGTSSTKCVLLNKTAIAEKPKETPKKKESKPSPDDNKIVPAGSGSGFFVSKDGHAITNYHVIEGCDISKLSFKGSQTQVKVLAVDKVNDIAILKSNAKPDVIFPVSNEDVSLLEDVIVAGFPLGKQISSAIKTHKGVVTALAGAGDNYSFFQTDATINQGNSGGPIINQKGNVVGIAVATWVEEGVQGVHFGIKSSTLKTFASANGLSFASPNFRDQSNKALGELITKGTVYVECHMTVAKIKKMIAEAENRKAFFKEHK